MIAADPFLFDSQTEPIVRPAPADAKPVRLLNVVPTFMCGGTEGQVMALCRSLDAKRFDLEFACLRRRGPFVKEIEDRRLPLAEYRFSSFSSATALRQQVKFAQHVARHRIDIVHAYSFYGNVFALPPARLARAPVVIASIRDLGPYLTPLQKRVQRYVCRLADCVVVNADVVRTWLIDEGYDAERIVVIRNGVDLMRFKEPSQHDRVRRDLELPRGVPLVAVVSRLSRLKGLEQFLEAAAVVGRRSTGARFLVIGETPPHDPEYLDELKNLAARLGIGDRVIFTGLRSDVPTLLAGVDVAVMPSLNEALSNALLESMAAGAPVVATRVGGTAEALVDGETGLLVPPDDVASLAGAVISLLEAPALASRLGRAARRSIVERFSVERMAETTERLYERLLTSAARTQGRRRSGQRRFANQEHA
jgi:glycosyltransferase involved in cell wall biosynthesis